MRRRINVIVAAVFILLTAGVVLAAIPKVRQAAANSQCQNNLKSLGLGLQSYSDEHRHYPPATIPNDALPCNKRLSWLADVVPCSEQMYFGIDRTKGWEAEENRVPMTKDHAGPDDLEGTLVPLLEVGFLHCPANTAVSAPGSLGLTDYVGISGVGREATELPLGYPGAGIFGCQRRTKKEDIKDGLANTIMVMETSTANGPWTAGGFPTARGLDPDSGPYLGAGGQFSSGHRSGGWLSTGSTVITNVVLADASVRGIKDSVTPEVLEALVTVAGGEEVGPYEE